MSISLGIRILLIFLPPNPNTLKNWNPNTFFFKIEGIREWHAENAFIWSESRWTPWWSRIRIHFTFCHRIRIQLPLERYGPQPKYREVCIPCQLPRMVSRHITFRTFVGVGSWVPFSSGCHSWVPTSSWSKSKDVLRSVHVYVPD